MTDVLSNLPNRLGPALRATGLIFLIGTSSAWGGSSVHIPKPNERLLPPPPLPTLERSVVNMEVSLLAEELALLVDQTFPPVVAHEEGWNDPALLPGVMTYAFSTGCIGAVFGIKCSRTGSS